jgi:flagellar motility protein MotE (MotC chaperone)
MPRQKGVTQLETLRRKQAEIAEQLKAAEARERDREKQNDAKRRDLLGSIILENLRTCSDLQTSAAGIANIGVPCAR